MALTNFSLPYQPATLPFFYTGNPSVNSFRLNAVLPSAPQPEYEDEEPFRNSPYAGYYQQQLQSQHRQQQRHRRPPRQRQTNQVFSGVLSSSSILSNVASNVDASATAAASTSASSSLSTSSLSSASSTTSFSAQDSGYVDYDQPLKKTEAKQIEEPQLVRITSPPVQPTSQNIGTTFDQVTPQSEPQPEDNYPGRPNGYTKVNSASYVGADAKTSIHAILDYDDDEGLGDYYDNEEQNVPHNAHVTPIQGPILLKNGTVPVVPLYSYPQLNNGTFVQIPILWTALSVALGVELKGDLVKGNPCIKKNHQLFCPTAGNTYPIERIERFIDENKALMKRMYGDFETTSDHRPPSRRRRMAVKYDLPDGGPRLKDTLEPDAHVHSGDSYFNNIRKPRQSTKNHNVNTETGRMDACESKIEIVTPYWASNSAGKVRAIVNTQHFEQAIHQEVCTKPRTNRCTGDCGCEQKYKWHRLLAYDPDNDCKGIFMDWFLFPSCCVCRCDPTDMKVPPSSENRN